MARRPVRIDKIKRPGGVFEFDMQVVAEDADGIWLAYTKGATWRAPHDTGTMPFDATVLLRLGEPFVTWWVDDPSDRRIEIDVCLPPVATDAGWSFVDLELDPVRHEFTGRIEIEDEDELQEACAQGWIDARDEATARATANAMADVLARGVEPWGNRGWQHLDDITSGRR